jgi:ABC-type multidrug transport system ATPase subunit
MTTSAVARLLAGTTISQQQPTTMTSTTTAADEVQSLNTKTGVRLDFKDICLTMPAKRKTPAKTILHNVSGFAVPGEVLYIMGPSGAGKTSLLDAVSGRTKVSPSGDILLAGCQKTDKSLKALSKYCTQEIQLYEAMTIKETLASAAALYTTGDSERDSRVEQALTMLGLQGQASVKIGGVFFRGCSGGQKRRVTVGEAVVAKPPIMFLDEPTSGLDSAAAYQLMLKLREIARVSRITVVCSIHQPSERVFELSDRLLLLAGGKHGGRTTYFGPTSGAAARKFSRNRPVACGF